MMISTLTMGALPSTTARIAKASTESKSVDSKGTAAGADTPSASTNTARGIAAKKDFQTVAADTRAALDASYKERGKTADLHTTGKEWEDMFAGMDRRSLYAIASNAGGQFSEIEQGAASSVMDSQLEKAMGSSQLTAFSSPSERAASAKAGVAFLDGASDEEKQSVRWASYRASAQNFYDIQASASGQPPENLESDNPLVKVLASAMKSSRGDPTRDRSEGRMDTLEGLMNQPWAKGFEAQIEQASRAVAKQGSLVDKTV